MGRNPSSTSGSPVAHHRRLWVKLLLAYLLSTVLILAGIGFLAYWAARNAMENQLGDGLVAAARTAANLVAKPRTFRLVKGDEQSLTYDTMKEKLSEHKKATQVELIYLFDRNKNALVDSDGAFSIAEHIVKLDAGWVELDKVFSGQSDSTDLFEGTDGQWYKTGFAPVWLEGKVVAAIGVDGSARFFDHLRELGGTMALVGAVAVVLIVMVTLFVSRGITLPLGRLAQSARAIGGGDLNREIDVETSDEIGVLAGTLNEMRKSIQERDRQLQMMLSGIAHEVRNPLGGMALFVGLLKEELFGNQTASKHLERIGTELDYLSRVVSDFLDFARERPVEEEELDPRAEFEQIQNLAAGDLERAGVGLELEVAADIEKVRWDRERMRRSLLNLVGNAVQASAAGGKVRISLKKHDGALLLSVADQGDGIPDDKHKKVFEAFYTTRQQGTGLGLALVKKVVEAHGGTIAFETESGRGTIFTIRLPADRKGKPAEQGGAAWPAS